MSCDFGAFLLVLSRRVVSAVVEQSLEAAPKELWYDTRQLFLMPLCLTPLLPAGVVMTLKIICISSCRCTAFFVGSYYSANTMVWSSAENIIVLVNITLTSERMYFCTLI